MATKKQNTEMPVEKIIEAPVEEPAVTKKPERDLVLVRMYVGPTLTRYGLIQNVNYEGLPAGIEDFFKACPLGKLLFIDISQYPEAERQIRTGDGYFYEAYMQAYKLKSNGGDN